MRSIAVGKIHNHALNPGPFGFTYFFGLGFAYKYSQDR